MCVSLMSFVALTSTVGKNPFCDTSEDKRKQNAFSRITVSFGARLSCGHWHFATLECQHREKYELVVETTPTEAQIFVFLNDGTVDHN